MITKERLEELIKEEKTIYYVNNYYNKVEEIFLNCAYEIIDNDERNCLTTYDIDLFYNVTYEFDKLFETKEEAEFVQKFHTSKTIYFEPPTWEEFLKTESIEKPANWSCGDIDIILHKKYKTFGLEDEIAVINGFNYRGFNYINKNGIDNRKEKYYEALEYAKKLFLEEEK